MIGSRAVRCLMLFSDPSPSRMVICSLCGGGTVCADVTGTLSMTSKAHSAVDKALNHVVVTRIAMTFRLPHDLLRRLCLRCALRIGQGHRNSADDGCVVIQCKRLGIEELDR